VGYTDCWSPSAFAVTDLPAGDRGFFVAWRSRSLSSSIAVGLTSAAFACLSLVAFAAEGAICIRMALPPALPLAALGALTGLRDPARSARRRRPASFLRPRRGEFRLTRLAGGRTRLEGTTWYENRMWPAAYWRGWSDMLIHEIHLRVLRHVRALSERRADREPAAGERR
jgi:hypothetical protein